MAAVSLLPEATTALHLAAAGGHLAVVDALLKHGANPFIEDGRRAPYLAIFFILVPSILPIQSDVPCLGSPVRPGCLTLTVHA